MKVIKISEMHLKQNEMVEDDTEPWGELEALQENINQEIVLWW